MNHFTTNDLKRLAAVEDELCISMYLPTKLATATSDEPRIHFKNLLRKAEKAVQEHPGKAAALQAGIEEGWRLYRTQEFWQKRSEGLAVFIAPEIFEFHRCPIPFEEYFSASTRFALKTLIPISHEHERFYILALSQSHNRLLYCTPFAAEEIDLSDAPSGKGDALQYDSKQTHLQFHTGTAGGSGDRPAMFHGQGVGVDDSKDEILRYFRKVDQQIAAVLPATEIPMVLAGVDYLLPIFREASTYQWLMEEAVTGNPEDVRAESLHEAALRIVRPVLEKAQRLAEDRYRETAGKGFTAVGVESVVPAAAFGRVETLFVAKHEKVPGAFHRDSGKVVLDDRNDSPADDLLELAVNETIRNGGSVYPLNHERISEQDATIAAILRY